MLLKYYLECFVSEEIDILIKSFEKSKAICFIPTNWKDVETDLSTNAKLQIVLSSKLFFAQAFELFQNFFYFVEFMELKSLFKGAISSDWRNIYEASSEFDKSSSKFVLYFTF
jgi:hypothetical protein